VLDTAIRQAIEMRIRFEQPYVPEEAPDSIRRLWRDSDWDAMPAVGDFVHHADEAAATRVVRIFWQVTGRALVHLHGNVHDGPTFSQQHLEFLEAFGWLPAGDHPS
jgi:hypothetical protein